MTTTSLNQPSQDNSVLPGTAFWHQFKNSHHELSRLSRFMSKSQFITLACKLNCFKDDGFFAKVFQTSQRILSMNSVPETVEVDGKQVPVAKIRILFKDCAYYISHIDSDGMASGWGTSSSFSFNFDNLPVDSLQNDEFKLDLDFCSVVVSPVFSNIRQIEGAL